MASVQSIKLRVFVAGAALVVLGSGIALWKAFFIGLPLLPSQPEGLWQVELQITGRGEGEDLSVRAALPEPGPEQFVFDERFSSGRLRVTLRDDPGAGRLAVWRGEGSDVFRIGAAFRVQLEHDGGEVPTVRVEPPSPGMLEIWGGSDADFPAGDPAVVALIESITDVPEDDLGGWARSLYGFVRHEIRRGAGDDPLIVLRNGEGSAEGRERLLATLLRAAGIPSRLARGLELSDGIARERVWCEAWIGERWWPLSATQKFFGRLPADFVRFRASPEPMVTTSGVESLEYRFRALPERLTPQELATLMSPDGGILSWVSLYRLPAGTQAALRVLLVLPMAALILAILRNVVGMPSYGTFMPILVALALRGSGLSMGLLLVAMVLSIGVLGRLLITRLRLLLVPRLSVLLSLVILTVALMGLLGVEFDDQNFFAGILFPIVILTMLVERFSITLAEEGAAEAVQRAAWSVLIAVLVYPVFRSEALGSIFFSYPELILVVMGLLVWLGAYTGYRLSDRIRFRAETFEASP